jgi:hypothetical protein
MFIKTYLLALLLTGSAAADHTRRAKKGMGMGMGSKKGSSKGRDGEELYLTVTNLAYQQPFSGFFVMVHNADVDPLFTLGMAVTEELAVFAEDGNPFPVAASYDGAEGVLSAVAFTNETPTFVGEKLVIPVTVTKDYPYVTIASMAINTNDCFVAINGTELWRLDGALS